MELALEPRHWVLLVFLASALYAHLRGTVRFGLVRALTDFTVLIAPVNALMYLFSRTPRTAYVNQEDFPELELLNKNCQMIRDEAMALADLELDRGGSDEARRGYELAADLLAGLGEVELAHVIDAQLGTLWWRAGQPFAALRRLWRAQTYFADHGLLRQEHAVLAQLEQVCAAVGDDAGGREVVARAAWLRHRLPVS